MNWWPTVWLAAPLLSLLLEAGYADWRTRKVPNRLVLLYLGVAAAAQGAVLVCWGLGVDGADLPLAVGMGRYALAWLLNGLMCFAMALFLWWVGLWPAGEAKLFSVAALLFPLWWFRHPLSGQFLGLDLLHNVFLVIFFQVLLDALWRLLNWRRLKHLPRPPVPEKEKKGVAVWLRTLLGIVVIFLFMRLLRLEVMHAARRVLLDTSLVYLAMVFLFHEIKELFNRPWVFALAVLGVLGFVAHSLGVAQEPARLLWLVNLSGYALSIIAVRVVYERFGAAFNLRPVAVEDLEQGMVLSSSTQRQVMSDRGFYTQNIERFFPDGLTTHQASNLKRWNTETGKLGETVWVAHTTPMAPVMALGFLLTALVQGALPLPVLVQTVARWLGG